MLFEEDMCGKGWCPWPVYNHGPAVLKDPLKDGGQSLKRDRNHRWYKCGRRPGFRGTGGRVSGHLPQIQRKKRARPPGLGASLRPVNIKGNRAPGMRAPRNTNQFLMHEKYQMMHMRSDSIGTDSGSDCDMDFTDMDSYLVVLENSRGALLDSPDPPDPGRVFPLQTAKHQQFPFFTFGDVIYQEDSMQYFPSEDDVMQSEDFMQKDFIDFCDTFRGTEHVA